MASCNLTLARKLKFLGTYSCHQSTPQTWALSNFESGNNVRGKGNRKVWRDSEAMHVACLHRAFRASSLIFDEVHLSAVTQQTHRTLLHLKST